MSLSRQTCLPCRAGAPTLTESQINKLKPQLHSDWQVVDNHHLTRRFKFKDFAAAIAFVNQVADIAEKQGHHPNIHLTGWNKVAIELYTHKISGLHLNDFILAAKIETLVEDYLDSHLIRKRLIAARKSDFKDFQTFWEKT